MELSPGSYILSLHYARIYFIICRAKVLVAPVLLFGEPECFVLSIELAESPALSSVVNCVTMNAMIVFVDASF